MAVYAIGDVQGCFDELERLLGAIQFDPQIDQLWFAGDLVNRGPKSLETLRFVKSLGESAITVLGNHDLHLLAASCASPNTSFKDSLDQVLRAPDSEELLDWLRRQPLLYSNNHYCLIHAGLPPQWDYSQAKEMACVAEKALRAPDYQVFLKQMYGNQPNCWSDNLNGIERLRFIINCFTRMRYCDRDGRLDFDHNGPPGTQPKHLIPWFELPNRKSFNVKIVCGHWSSLGYYTGNNCYAIDTGCLWGGQLTALQLGEEVRRFSIDCPGRKKLTKQATI